MRVISKWAKNHKWAARLVIVTCYILLFNLGITTGTILSELNISFSSLFVIALCLFLGGLFFYPNKEIKEETLRHKSFYLKQKLCDFALASSFFILMLHIGNDLNNSLSDSRSLNIVFASSTSLPHDSSIKSYQSISSFSNSMKDEYGKTLKWKEKKRLLRKQINGIKKTKDISDGEKTLLVVLSILVALGLLMIVVGISCQLSCSGAGTAAAIVFIGGVAIIVFLFVVVINSIYRRKRKPNIIKPSGNL